tara:strand:- start:18551 stop:19681 length:1131 start_codon:yes stop_codon:yes gene_type:complete
MSKSYFAVVAVMAFAGVLVAQRPVVTVGGTNPNHPDLPQAIAAAAPGSIVEVRPGTYTGFTCQKALRIVMSGATVLPPAGANYTINLQNIVGADPFVIKGMSTLIGPGALGAMRISNVMAPIIIEKVTMVGGPQQTALEVFNTGSVHLARLILLGYPALQAQFCNLISNENLFGNAVGPGAIISDASMESARSVYVGTGQPALRIFDTVARLSSDGTGGMYVTGTPVVPVSSFEAVDSEVYWNPTSFLLAPANGAPGFLSQTTVEVIEEVPMLNAGPAVLGGISTARMTSPTPALGMIAVGYLLPSPIGLPPARVYPDPATFVLAIGGLVDAAGLQLNFAIPNNPVLRGDVLVFQGITFLPSGGTPLSGPALWYVE